MSASFPVDDDSRWRVSTATQGQTAFTVPFPFQLKTDITVWRQSLSGLIDTTLELDVDYTLTGAGNPGGGTVTLIVPAIAGEKIYRIGQASLDRTSSVVRNGKFSSEALDDDLDRSTIALQEFRRDVGRSWKTPFGEEGGVINLGAAGRALIYDENGGLSPGPNAETIEAAQSHAETAEQAAGVAVGAAGSATAHDAAAEESAGIAASAAQAATQAAGQIAPLAGAITTAADNIAAIQAAPQAATDAATARDLSQKFATHPEDQTIPGTGGLFSSFHWARKALASAASAAASVVGAVKANVAQAFSLQEQGRARANIAVNLMADFREKFINPLFDIAQRGNSGTIAAGAQAFVGDRWILHNTTNQPLTWQILPTSPASVLAPRISNYLSVNFATAPTSGNVYLHQRISNLRAIVGAEDVGYTLAGYFRAPALTQIVAQTIQRFGSGGSADVYTNQNVADIDASNVRQRRAAFITLPNTAAKTLGNINNLAAGWVVTARAAGSYFFGRMSFVEGDATAEVDPGPQRPVLLELSLCEPYLETSYPFGVPPGTISTGGDQIRTVSTQAPNMTYRYRTRKRATPTLTLYNPTTGASGSVRNLSASTNLTAVVGEVTETGYRQDTPTASANQTIAWHYVAEAEEA